MLQEIIGYTKCAIKNKFTLTGYSILGAAALAKYIEYETGADLMALDAPALVTYAFVGESLLCLQVLEKKLINHIGKPKKFSKEMEI